MLPANTVVACVLLALVEKHDTLRMRYEMSSDGAVCFGFVDLGPEALCLVIPWLVRGWLFYTTHSMAGFVEYPSHQRAINCSR